VIPYCGPAPVPLDLWIRWNWDPWLIGILVGVAAVGMWAVAARPAAVSREQITAGAGAWTLLAVLFVSPLCALTTALFSARVVHHVLLFAVAAPLVALAFRDVVRRKPLGHMGLFVAFAVQMAMIWVWHAPGPYAAALANTAIYWLMQLTLLGSALAFWRAVFSADTNRLISIAMVLCTMVHMALLGAIITFAPQALYEPHAATTLSWGLRQLEDQQLGGLIMWVPAAVPYLIASIVLSLPLLRPLATGARR